MYDSLITVFKPPSDQLCMGTIKRPERAVSLSYLDPFMILPSLPIQPWAQALAMPMRWFSALQLQDQFPSHDHGGAQTVRSALVALSRRSLWMCAVQSIQSWSVIDAICSNSVLSAFDKSHEWHLALTFANWMMMHQVQSDSCTLNTLVSACSGQGEWSRVSALFQAFLVRKIETDSISWSAAVDSSAQSMLWGRACGILAFMRTTFSHLNDVARSAGVHSCLQGAWQRALQVAGKIRPFSSGYRAVANALLGNCQRSSAWELSMTILRRLGKPKPRSYTAAIGAMRETEWALAADLLGHMKASRVLPDAVTINACMSALELGSAWKASLNMIGHTYAVRLSLGAPAMVVQILSASRFRRWRAALSAQRKDPGVNHGIVGNALLAACERGHSWTSSLSLLHQSSISTVEMDAIGRSSVMTACSRARQDVFEQEDMGSTDT